MPSVENRLNKDYSKIANDMDDMLSGGLTKDSDPERFASVQEGMEHFRSTVLAFVEKHKEKR